MPRIPLPLPLMLTTSIWDSVPPLMRMMFQPVEVEEEEEVAEEVPPLEPEEVVLEDKTQSKP